MKIFDEREGKKCCKIKYVGAKHKIHSKNKKKTIEKRIQKQTDNVCKNLPNFRYFLLSLFCSIFLSYILLYFTMKSNVVTLYLHAHTHSHFSLAFFSTTYLCFTSLL